MYYPTLKEARALAQSGPYGQVPVTRELLSDFITPIQALRILRSQDNHCFLLESAADSQGWADTPSWVSSPAWRSPVKTASSS